MSQKLTPETIISTIAGPFDKSKPNGYGEIVVRPISEDDHGIDDFVAKGNLFVHIERMDDGHIWMAFHIGDRKERLVIDLYSKSIIEAVIQTDG